MACCIDCGIELTGEEAHYYAIRCEECEKERGDRVTAWMDGADDPELDALYDPPEEFQLLDLNHNEVELTDSSRRRLYRASLMMLDILESEGGYDE